MPDLVHQLREAIVAILEADAAVLAAAGGSIRVVDRSTSGPAVALPAIAYEVLSFTEANGNCALRLSAIADAPMAGETSRGIAGAAVNALTAPAFAAHTLDVVPLAYQDENIVDNGGSLIEGMPNARQTDRALVLRVLD